MVFSEYKIFDFDISICHTGIIILRLRQPLADGNGPGRALLGESIKAYEVSNCILPLERKLT
jgi:hypothetical protein